MADGHRFRFPRSARLRRAGEIRRLLRDGDRRRCGPLEVYRDSAAGERPRAGVVVPRYGHTIVERNRLRRRLSECVRTIWLPQARRRASRGTFLVRARPGAYELGFTELREAFLRCTEAAA